ncbi:MAG: N-acetyltransferase family protein [Oscillospiraceae bacterium]|nr:N-acetyltransferase family protein [Oscillospiraceae bacterium]
MPNIEVRLARPEDAEGIAALYAEYVETTAAALDLAAPTAAQMEQKICNCGTSYPFLVCERDGDIVAYAYAFRRFEEQAFNWSVFVSAYSAVSIDGKGAGRALLDALEETLRAMGVVNIYTIVIHNDKSQYYHLARGFTEAGLLREAAYKQGKWRDLAYYQKSIALHDTNPAPVRSVGELDAKELEKIFARARRAIRL